MKQRFIAIRKARSHTLSFSAAVPVRLSGHRTRIGAKANEHGITSIPVERKLSEVEFTDIAHVGSTRVSEMRVVRPHNNFRIPFMMGEMANERIQRVAHILIAQIP